MYTEPDNSSRHMSKILINIMLSALVLFGCSGGKQTVTRYYLLDYPEAHQSDQTGKDFAGLIPFTCKVMPVDMHPAFATHQIAIREDAHQINYFSFNEWAVRPAQSFEKLLITFIEDNELCHSIIGSQSLLESDYTIKTYVSRIDVTQERKAFEANLSVEFRLLDNESNRPITIYHADRNKPLQNNSLNEFASAISEMFVEELYSFASQISIQQQAE